MEVKIKKLKENTKLPKKAHDTDACFDIYANVEESVMLNPRDGTLLPTGFATEIPVGYCALIFPRSGLATKQHLRLSNCVAVIDADYRGEWKIPLYNDGYTAKYINNGDRIAQFMLYELEDTSLVETDILNSSERGDGGFGSTGNK